MRRFFLLLVSSSLFFLTGCLEVLEEVYLNQNGSGKYLVTMDMSELFSDPMLKGMINDAAKKETGNAEDAPLEVDSVMYFRNEPQFKELSKEDQALIQDVTIKMKASESKGEMIIQLDFPFKNLDEFKKMNEVMAKIKTDDAGGGAGSMMGNGMLGTQGAQFELSKRVLTRLPAPPMKDLFGDDDQMAMVKMFFEGASYTTVYHLPGKVKKTDIANATVDGKTVTVENSFLDILEGKADMAGEIKFKKK